MKTIWTLLKQQPVGGSGTIWAMCISAPCSRQTITPSPTIRVFLQRQSTEGKYIKQDGLAVASIA